MNTLRGKKEKQWVVVSICIGVLTISSVGIQ